MIEVREAGEADNRGLLELVRASPMQGDFTLSIEREPEFFALARARGSGCTLVCEQDAKLIGCVSVAERAAMLNGKPGSIRVVSDLRILPAYRGRKVAQHLIAQLAERERERATSLYVAATAAGNRAVEGALARFGQTRPLTTLSQMASYQLFPAFVGKPRRAADGLELGPASDVDDRELCALLARFHQPRSLAPVFDSGFAEIVERSPGLERKDILLARRRGQLVAALGVWDAHKLKQTRVLKVKAALGVGLATARALGRVLPLPPVPTVGQPLLFRYLRPYACEPGEESALGALLDAALRLAQTQREHFALFTCASDDPIQRCLQGRARLRYDYQLVACTNHPQTHPALLLPEGSLCYDDAALA